MYSVINVEKNKFSYIAHDIQDKNYFGDKKDNKLQNEMISHKILDTTNITTTIIPTTIHHFDDMLENGVTTRHSEKQTPEVPYS